MCRVEIEVSNPRNDLADRNLGKPRFRSARSFLGLETSILTRHTYKILIIIPRNNHFFITWQAPWYLRWSLGQISYPILTLMDSNIISVIWDNRCTVDGWQPLWRTHPNTGTPRVSTWEGGGPWNTRRLQEESSRAVCTVAELWSWSQTGKKYITYEMDLTLCMRETYKRELIQITKYNFFL